MLSNGINWFLRSVLLVRFPTRWLTAPAPALPLSPRGSRNTPFSSRLYHSTKPSPSQCKIFNRSPRRERNTNRCPLSGFSPITACTRSASRSNPQRMSVASTASQMRAACAPSSARKLGSPITPLPPRPPAPALARRHSLAPPPGSARSATVSRPAPDPTRSAPARCPPTATRSRPARRGGPAALPRTCLRRHASPLLRHCACSLAKPPPAAASSTSKSAARTTDAPGRTPPHSARSAPARQPASATSLAPSCSVLAASLCLPPRHPAQCSTPPRPHKMPFTYRSRSMTASGSKPWPPEAPHSHPRWLPVPPQPHTTLELPQGLLGRPYRVHRFGPVEPAQGTLPLLLPPHKAGWPRASSWRSPVLRRTYGQGSSLLAVLPGQQQPTRGEMPLYDRPQHRSLPGSRSPRGFGRPHCPPSLLA